MVCVASFLIFLRNFYFFDFFCLVILFVIHVEKDLIHIYTIKKLDFIEENKLYVRSTFSNYINLTFWIVIFEDHQYRFDICTCVYDMILTIKLIICFSFLSWYLKDCPYSSSSCRYKVSFNFKRILKFHIVIIYNYNFKWFKCKYFTIIW